MLHSVAHDDDAYAVSDGLGVIASAEADTPLPSDPEALLWLIHHVRDVWAMRMAEAKASVA